MVREMPWPLGACRKTSVAGSTQSFPVPPAPHPTSVCCNGDSTALQLTSPQAFKISTRNLLSSNKEKARQMRGGNSRLSAMYCSFRDTMSFSVTEFELLGERTVSSNAYLITANWFHSLDWLSDCNGKNCPKFMPMFLACTEHAHGQWYLYRLLLAGGQSQFHYTVTYN